MVKKLYVKVSKQHRSDSRWKRRTTSCLSFVAFSDWRQTSVSASTTTLGLRHAPRHVHTQQNQRPSIHRPLKVCYGMKRTDHSSRDFRYHSRAHPQTSLGWCRLRRRLDLPPQVEGKPSGKSNAQSRPPRRALQLLKIQTRVSCSPNFVRTPGARGFRKKARKSSFCHGRRRRR
jgi:hypothetical protein